MLDIKRRFRKNINFFTLPTEGLKVKKNVKDITINKKWKNKYT